MVQEYRTGDEPIPGYRLSKFLGRGGFGEVWQAVAPGRTEVALKIISLDRKQGMKEFRSLRLVKRIRHPNLVPILAFWLKDADGNVMDDDSAEVLGANVTDSQWQGKSAYFNVARADQLVIAMGLGDKNLLALLEEYRAVGRPGIPEEELLDYMEGCARAIDFLNSPRHELGSGPVAIQHCDIKPQNIMIVGDAVQLCDFGLARSLTDVRSTSVAGSIAYGAPELFWENKPSEATDQYSLAISYYELRTGQLPFGPEMAHLEVMQAHRDGNLDFSYVADAEREVLLRATAPSPAGRFARTIDMVRSLRKAVQSASQVLPAAAPQAPSPRSDTSLLVTGREIVPGHTLLEHLFHADTATDVWSATSADGKPLALWIYDLARTGGLPDLASVRMAQAFSHPQFARLQDFWLQDAAGRTLPLAASIDSGVFVSSSRLIVASELARTNLAHRLEESRETLGTGIPQSELLGYMRQLAGAVDALNEARHVRGDSRRAALVHCDLRPANLLLFRNDVKIGNLAWVRALESDAMQLPAGARRSLRPFAGPELARDRLTRWSDQYALAACYIVLRTGGSAGDLSSVSGAPLASSSSALDLSKLPAAEMAVLARALNARPEQRFASCREMVAALEAASKPSATGGAAAAAPSAPPAGGWTGTIVSPGPEALASGQDSALVLGEAEAPVSISETAPEHDARRSTLIEPFGASPPEGTGRKSRRGVKRALLGAAVAAALAAAFVVGDDAQHDAEQLAGAGQYKQSIESLDGAPAWRCWRIDRPALRRTIVNQAVAAAEAAAKAGKVAEACSIFAELAAMPEVLLKSDIDGFRDTILPAALKRANEDLTAGRFRQAGEIERSLAGVFEEDFEVVDLGKNILDQGAAAALEYAHLDDFKTAIAIYSDLNGFAPAADQIDDLRAELIRLGREAVERRQKPDELAAALAIYRPLEAGFPQDHGVLEIGQRLIAASIALAEQYLNEDRSVEAKILYRELAQLRPDDSKIAALSKRVLAAELAPAEKLLAEGNWTAALAAFQRSAAEWPAEEKSFAALKEKIVARGRAEVEAQCETMESLDQARESVDRLSAAAPNDRAIAALKDRVRKLSEGHAPADGPEQIVVGLLNQVDGDLETGLVDGSEPTLKRAEAEAAKLSGRKSLLQRLLLARAHVAVRQKRWDEAAKLLDGLQATDFAGADRGRFDALRAFALARFDGAELAPEVDLGRLVQAIVAAPQDDPSWKTGKRFRIDADRLNKLAGQAMLRAIDLAYSEQPEDRRLAGETLGALAADFMKSESIAIQARFAAAQTHLLLAAENPARDAVVASLAKWRDQAGEIGRQPLAAAARDLSRWAIASQESGVLQAAIAALSDLRRHNDEAKTEYAGLSIEQLAREATLAAPDWAALNKQCQLVEDAVTVAGGHSRLSFVKACRAECALETPDEASRAAALVAEARRLPAEAGDRPYLDYLEAVAQASATSTPSRETLQAAAAKLEAAFAQPAAILDVARRKTRAAQTLNAAAGRLSGLGDPSAPSALDPPAVAAKDADEAYRWLQLAARLSPAEPSAEARLALAVATLRKTEPDASAAKRLAGELVAAGRREAWLLLFQAHEIENDQPEQAAVWYAEALAQIDLNALVGESAAQVYSQIVQPGVALAQRKLPAATSGAAARQAVAKLYAARGRLLRANSTLAESGSAATEEAFKAFDHAILYDAENPELYVERGYARWAKGREDAKVLEPLEREDIEKAFALKTGDPSPAALGLRGIARLLASRNQSGGEQVDALKGAIEDYEAAIAASRGEGEHYSEFLDGAASAYVELANFSPEAEQYRNYLGKAIERSQESSQIEYRPNPEFAWLNLGNAEEDMSDRAHDYGVDHYCRAIDAFQNAAAAAVKSGRPPEFALYCEGRCRSKLVDAVVQGKIDREQTCGAPIEEHIQAGLRALNAPAENLKGAIQAESRLWQARLYVLQARTTSGAQAKQAALAGADAALKAALDVVDENDPSWPLYQREYAENAWNMKNYDAAGQRALALVDSKSPYATIEKKCDVLHYVADGYKAAGDAKRGLQVFDDRLADPDFLKSPSAKAQVLVSKSNYILKSGLWLQYKQACESGAKEAIELAQKERDSRLEADAWLAFYDHLLRAHPQPLPKEMKQIIDCLRKALALGLPPADRRNATLQLAYLDLAIAAKKNLPAAERIQFAQEGLQALDKDLVAAASPQRAREIEELRSKLEENLAEAKQAASQNGKAAPSGK